MSSVGGTLATNCVLVKFFETSDEANSKASTPIEIRSRTSLDSIIKLLHRNSGRVWPIGEGSSLCTNCHLLTPSYLDLTHELYLPLQILTALALAVPTWRCVPQTRREHLLRRDDAGVADTRWRSIEEYFRDLVCPLHFFTISGSRASQLNQIGAKPTRDRRISENLSEM